MKTNQTFKKIEDRIRYLNKDQDQYRIDGDGNRIDAVFTTSEEEDIIEMINDGMSIEEIILEISKWNDKIMNMFYSKRN